MPHVLYVHPIWAYCIHHAKREENTLRGSSSGIPLHPSYLLPLDGTLIRKLHVSHLVVNYLLLIFSLFSVYWTLTVMRRLTTGIRSEKCVVRRFRRCANVYLHKPRWYTIAYCTSRPYGTAYCS